MYNFSRFKFCSLDCVAPHCAALPVAHSSFCSAILGQYEGVMRVHNFMGNTGGTVPAAGGSGRGSKNKQTAEARDSEEIMSEALHELTTETAAADKDGGSGGSGDEILCDGWQFFTEGQRGDDRMRREIFAVEATPLDPAIACSGEWIQIRIVGSSFVLHQIRKMIGAALYCLWGENFLPRRAFDISLQGVELVY